MGIKLYRFLLGFIGFVELCIGFYWVLLGLSNYGVRRKRGIRHFMGFVAYGICHPMGFVAYGDSHLMMFVANRVFSF